MLSVLFSVYDPLGFIAPSILEPKLIVQECWKRNLDWDDSLTCDLISRLEKWQKNVFDKRYKSTTFLRFQRT